MWIIKNQKKLQQFYITQSHRHIPGSSLPGGNTWFSPLADPSCSRRGWLTSVETMDMWWLIWTMLCSLPFGSEKKSRSLSFGGLNLEWQRWSKNPSTYHGTKINRNRHSHLVIRLEEDLIVFWQSHQKDDRRYILEAVDPLSALRSLASHVDHSKM